MAERVRRRLVPGAREQFLAVYVRGSAATALAARRWRATRRRLDQLADGPARAAS